MTRFSLNLGTFYYDDMYSYQEFVADRIRSCFNWACTPKTKLQQFSFKISGDIDGNLRSFPIPLSVFQLSSIVFLQLDPWISEPHGYDSSLFHLPNLKKLIVTFQSWTLTAFENLLLASPCLQFLSLYVFAPSIDHYHTVNLSSPMLTRLEMTLFTPMFVVINTPNLEYLRVHLQRRGTPYRLSFVKSPPSLLACSLWECNRNLEKLFLPSNFFSGISGVTSLTVSDFKPCPLLAGATFRCLTHLKINVDYAWCNTPLFPGLALLQQCPVLEVLTFDLTHSFLRRNSRSWLLPDFTPQCLVTCVKRIEILIDDLYDGVETPLLHLLKYLLGSAKTLELLKINIARPDMHQYPKGRNRESLLIKELCESPRSSPHCRVESYGLYRGVLSLELLSRYDINQSLFFTKGLGRLT